MKTAYAFPFGTLIIEYEEDILLKLRCTEEKYTISEEEIGLRSDFTELVMRQVNEFLQGNRTQFDLSYRMEGTEFQKKVWNALLKIPYGETRTYGQIAKDIGNPRAGRAVGMAGNKNPLLLIIPCHRMIGADGSLTGYAGGLTLKRYLLDIERG